MFAKASAYGRPQGETGEIVDEEWLKSDYPNLDNPWNVDREPDVPEEKGFWLLSSKKRRKKVDHVQVRHELVKSSESS